MPPDALMGCFVCVVHVARMGRDGLYAPICNIKASRGCNFARVVLFTIRLYFRA